VSLTDNIIRSARADSKPSKLSDGDGLVLLVNPGQNGSKLWRFRYRFQGVEKMISLGTYPEVSLKLARSRCVEARQLVAAGADPSVKRQEKQAAAADTFEAVARDYLAQQKAVYKPVTLHDTTWRLEEFLLPALGARPIAEIKAPDVLLLLKRMQQTPSRTGRPLTDTIQRTKQLASRIFRHAIEHNLCEYDPVANLRSIKVQAAKHHAAITDPRQVGELLRAMDSYQGSPATRYALRLLPLVFLRSSELRNATWDELNLETAEWRVPATRMKMNQEHVVPLSRQAVEALTELKGITGGGKYLFPSLVPGKPICENTLNLALARLGYSSDVQTPHGFRTIASTLLNEMGWAPDVIELQLAHQERNKVRAAYNRAQRLDERRKMMQAYADHLDSLKKEGPR